MFGRKTAAAIAERSIRLDALRDRNTAKRAELTTATAALSTRLEKLMADMIEETKFGRTRRP